MSKIAMRILLGLTPCGSGAFAEESLQAVDPDTVLDTLVPGHPRLMLNDADLEKLRQRHAEDETLEQYVRDVLETADGYLEAPVLERKLIGPRLLRVSRAAAHRIYALSFAWRWTGAEKYAERGEHPRPKASGGLVGPVWDRRPRRSWPGAPIFRSDPAYNLILSFVGVLFRNLLAG